MGQRAGLFGNETGNFEAWIYPLKILRDFHLNFLVDGRTIPAEALARTLTVRPESEHHPLHRGYFRGARNLLCPGSRTRRRHPHRR